MKVTKVLREDESKCHSGIVIEDGILLYIRDNVCRLNIPEGVIGIDDKVAEESDVYIVSFPSTLKTVGDDAFNRSKLTEAIFQDGLMSIGKRVFYSNRDLKRVYLPDSVQSIGEFTFASCINLTGVRLPKTLKEFPKGLFNDCRSLQHIIIPDGVEVITSHSCTDCASLIRIDMPISVHYLAYWSIAGNPELTKIVYKGSMTQFHLIAKDSGWHRGCGRFTVCCTDGNIDYGE